VLAVGVLPLDLLHRSGLVRLFVGDHDRRHRRETNFDSRPQPAPVVQRDGSVICREGEVVSWPLCGYWRRSMSSKEVT
jgi:hypothetical protein